MMKKTLATPVPGPTQPRPSLRPEPAFNEGAVWQPVMGNWRPLFGDYYDLGVTIQWHDFRAQESVEWSRSFHEGSVEICLNLTGNGSVLLADRHVQFGPATAGFYLPRQGQLRAWRKAGENHQFVTIELSRAYLQEHLGPVDGALHPLIEQFVGGQGSAGFSEIRRLSVEQEQLIRRLQAPGVFQAARPLWYRGKVLELMAEFFFERSGADELFCDRQQRTARERVDRVIGILRARLSEPPSLGDFGREVGCSPFHLSRTFSRETGMTIPQYLRKLRMERAAELLGNGKHNVTEAALEVGYSSLSHFSQAFCETMGCCPALYSLRPNSSSQPVIKFVPSATRRQ